jgi:hypothetical protein
MELSLWTGQLFPRKNNTKRFWKIGKPIGTANPAPNGYHYVSFGGRRILSHRVVFKWVHGIDPLGEIDHIDRNKANNCPFNLRCLDRRGQSLNSSIHIGALGVSRQDNGKWRAHHCFNGKQLGIGGFATEAEAIAARKGLMLGLQAANLP